jgi:hypothetical protein
MAFISSIHTTKFTVQNFHKIKVADWNAWKWFLNCAVAESLDVYI